MQPTIINPAARLWAGFILGLFASLSCPLDFDEKGEFSVWARFMLGVQSTAALVALVPVLWQGRGWQRGVAAVLILGSSFIMLTAFSYLLDQAR